MNKNEIANLALSNLGQNIKVIDFNTDQSHPARIIKQWWRSSLEELLEMHPWNFATSFAPLPVGLTTPSAGFRFAYVKPSDALVLRRLARDGKFPKAEVQEEFALRWREVNVGTGTEVWCDVENAHAEYTVNIDDDYNFPNYFAKGLSYQLAQDIGPKLITQNWPKVMQNLIPLYKNEIDKAMAKDIAHQPDMPEYQSSFIRVRGGY